MANLFCSPGPTLPRFSTLLIKGAYPPSAPIYLCASYLESSSTSSHGRALFLTPSRETVATALEEHNDGWMASRCMTGTLATLFSRIDMFYPPTTKHWLLLLSLFRPLENSSDTPRNIAVFSHKPSLILLHEPSSYFLSSDSRSQPHHGELTQYLQLVTAALSLSSFLSGSREVVPVVLFDSRIDELKLPIVRPVTPSRRNLLEEDAQPTRQEHVERFVEKYFEWIGNVTSLKAEGSPSTPPLYGTFDAAQPRSGLYKLKLYNRVSEDNPPIIWEWTEARKPRRSNTGRMETQFVFHNNSS